jgi:hypothetical protein
MEALLVDMGIKTPDLFAAFAGSVVAALLMAGSKPNPWTIFCSIVIGTFTGVYLGPLAPSYVNAKPSNGWTFITGLAGTPICRGIIAAAGHLKWAPPNGKDK